MNEFLASTGSEIFHAIYLQEKSTGCHIKNDKQLYVIKNTKSVISGTLLAFPWENTGKQKKDSSF